MSKPPKHTLPLLEALEAWAEPGTLVEPLCRNGEWRCWARRGSRDGPWDELWAEEWSSLQIVDQDCILRTEAVRQERQVRQDGRTMIVIEEQKRATEMWFAPVFAPAAPAPRKATAHTFKQWVDSLGRTPTIDECCAEFSGTSRDTLRGLKRKYAPGKRGRKPKFGG